ncbi:RNA polymerase sigma factor [Streptomyces sp. NA04227]|uniref:RNA polymerase sigma factor n=1 Tax=Streptomyces sp. NA04227 TaxID=2742136 RepID=UPI001591E6C7|nr:RNA polymerase sigma factor [Streptomyces sp. NA04227]QKW08144.1 RNA polymerase sigma factor [Streptomyces sp. NA04227]
MPHSTQGGGTKAPAPPPTDRTTARASFDEVFCSLLDRLYRRAAILAGTPHAAEDAVHEVYLKLVHRPERFLAHPEPYAYAFATLVSVLRSGWRRDRRQTPVAEVEQTWVAGQSAHWAWDGGVEQRAGELGVVALLGQLTVRQAGVIILVDLDGYTIDQAAEILGVHRGTVSRNRDRGLHKLRGSLRRIEREGRRA